MSEQRLIDANQLSVEILDAPWYDNQDEDVAWGLVQSAPTLDAAVVVRGEWLKKPYLFGTSSFCSLCGSNYGMPHETYHFCPNCGSKMDKEETV